MRLPGFTAEASIYRGQEQNYMGKILSHETLAMQPAIGPDPSCFGRCREDCQDAPDVCFAICNNECGGILLPIPFPT